jgi:hypothetical protein
MLNTPIRNNLVEVEVVVVGLSNNDTRDDPFITFKVLF